MIHYISSEHLTIDRVEEILASGAKLALSDDARKRIVRCREYLDKENGADHAPDIRRDDGLRLALQHLDRGRRAVAAAKESDDVARLRHRRPRTGTGGAPDGTVEGAVALLRPLGRTVADRRAHDRDVQQRHPPRSIRSGLAGRLGRPCTAGAPLPAAGGLG